MKANLPKSYQKQKSSVLLSIGMIVKNEENTLEECLQALQPLRQAVSCELIVADTGSDDRTVEIAQKYADKILHFTWCNDFAAARNTTIEAMEGAWYMYLDADEIFDGSIMEIARFFESGDYKKYETATYIQRNYNDFQHHSFSDYRAMRMRRKDERLWFSGIIHEQLPATEPICQLEAVAHHEGYVTLHVGSLLKQKSVRNRPLLEAELQKNPNSPRLYRHLADCYLLNISEQWEQKEQCLQKGIEAEKDSNEGMYGGSLEVELARFYQTTLRPDALQAVLKSWFGRPHTPIMADCEMHYLAGQDAFQFKRYEEALEHFKEFFKMYERYLHNGFGLSVNMVIINYATPEGAARAKAMTALCCARLGREEEARDWMRQAQPGKSMTQNGKPLLLEQLFEYLTIIPDFELLEEAYKELYQADPVFTQQLMLCAEKALPAKCERKTQLLEVLAKQETPDPTAALARLRLGKTVQAPEKDFELILHSEDALENDAFAEAVYAALKQPEIAGRFFEAVPWEKAPVMALLMQRWHMGFARRVYTYLRGTAAPENQRVLYWRWQLAENAVTANNDFTHEEWWQMLEQYAAEGACYCEMLYQKEIWSEEGAACLPPDHSYLFYLKNALQKKRDGNEAEYLRYLRLGLHRYEKMKATTEYLLKTFQNEMKKEEKAHHQQLDEMEQLKRQIKQNIRQLAGQKKTEEAVQLLQRYRQIAPMDPEIDTITAEIMN